MRSRARRLFVVLVAVAMSLAGATAHAQYRASLQGTVTDAQGGAIPGATVTLVDKETNRTLTAVTNENGVYVFNALAPRPYTIEVELTGLQEGGARRTCGSCGEQANTLDVKLEIGGATETVNVAAVAPLIDTATASVAGTVTAQQIQTMPSAGRDVLQLLQLAPGAFGTGARNRRRHREPAGHDDRRIGRRDRASSPPRTAARSSPTAPAPARTTIRSTASA